MNTGKIISECDETIMLHAIDLARKGKGRVEPNPMVGACIVKDGKIIAEGYHHSFGMSHAEVEAIRNAGEKAAGSTLYVSLEPCNHYGKTPPCTDLIITSQIKRVFVAMEDPNEMVKGKGIEKLKSANVEVVVGCMEEEAKKLNAPYVKLVTRSIPYFIAKWAMTLDGKIATYTGTSKWISCETSRNEVHKLRNIVDAILIGINTVLKDNPSLTCRLPDGRNPKRIVLDARCQIPLDSKIITTASESEVIIATSKDSDITKRQALEQRGCMVISVETTKDGHIDVRRLAEKLGEMKFTNVLVEGGAGILWSFFEAQLIDEVMIFIAPKIFGGSGALSPVGGGGVSDIEQAFRVSDITVTNFGCDTCLKGIVKYS